MSIPDDAPPMSHAKCNLGAAPVMIQDRDVAAAALAAFRRRPASGFSDCPVVELARKAGHSPLGTFDATQARVDGVVRV